MEARSIDLAQMSHADKLETVRLLEEARNRQAQRLFYALFPDEDSRWTGPSIQKGLIQTGQTLHARHKYAKHMEFFRAGAKFPERCAMCANRIGKTMAMGGYEMACHLTGDYPEWWPGRRFKHPISAWAAGKGFETTRDIMQLTLLGRITHRNGRKTVDGRGIIPGERLGQPNWKSGVADLVDTIMVRHESGGWSDLSFKSYEQGRGSFEGTGKHVCLSEGELVQMADGTLRPIEQVSPGDFVLSIGWRGEVVKRRVAAVHDNGLRDCVRLIPKQGTPVVLTPDHEVYWGYRRESKAQATETKAIAGPRPGTYWPSITYDRADAWYIWAGLAIAEGSYRQRKVTNGNETLMQQAIAALPSTARVRRKVFQGGHVPDWFLYWDLFWATFDVALSSEKVIPDWVFQSSKAKATLFLRWLYAGDGWASGHTIGYATTSETLAQQIVLLLNRLGVRAAMYRKPAQQQGWADQWWVQITRSSDVLTFLNTIGIEGKDEACGKVRAEAERRVASKHGRARHLLRGGQNHQKWQDRNDAQRTKASKIRAIEPAGMRRVYDLSVDTEHRYLAGTNLVSNCWLDEEPPMDVYGECLIRTATTQGIIYITFTPLEGMSHVVLSFLPADQRPDFEVE